MLYLREFNTHASYEDKINIGGSDLEIPIVSYCDDVSDVHYNPYNTVEFYVGEITGTTPKTVSIYTDETNHVNIQVSKGNKWYSYVLQKDNGLFKIEGDSVKKAVIKTNISYSNDRDKAIIPPSTAEASFKGSNTTNVTDMSSMFDACSNLTSLDVSNFDTRKVTDMSYMFYGCSNLTSLDLSSFDTSNVTNMNGMFWNCSGLISLDVSSFNTSKVTNMGFMFSGCNGLTSLDLSGLNTSNVTNMARIFNDCIGITSLDLSGWVISDATNTNDMFSGCSKLETIRMVGCNQTTINKIASVKPSSATIIP